MWTSGGTFDNTLTPANTYASINVKGWAAVPDACQSTFLMVAATIYLCKIPVPYTTTITNIVFNIVTTAASAQSNSQVGLYDSTGVLLSSSADLGTTWQSTGTKTNALAVAQAITGGPTVFVYAALHQGAGTPPTIQASGALASATLQSYGMTAATTRFGTQTGHATNNLATIGNLTLSSTTALVRFLPVMVS